jgi:hypothetical protein
MVVCGSLCYNVNTKRALDKEVVQSVDSHTIPLSQKACVLTRSLTFTEFLDSAPTLASTLRSRRQEIRMSPEVQDFLVTYPEQLHWVLLLEVESPETLVVVPILWKMAQTSPRITLTIMRDTDDLHALARLVDEPDLSGDLAEVALPLLLIFDEEWNLQTQWGPHPQEAERQLDEWFVQHPNYEALAESDDPAEQNRYALLLDQLTWDMRVWYNSGLSQACISELHRLLVNLLEDSPADEDEQEVMVRH